MSNPPRKPWNEIIKNPHPPILNQTNSRTSTNSLSDLLLQNRWRSDQGRFLDHQELQRLLSRSDDFQTTEELALGDYQVVNNLWKTVGNLPSRLLRAQLRNLISILKMKNDIIYTSAQALKIAKIEPIPVLRMKDFLKNMEHLTQQMTPKEIDDFLSICKENNIYSDGIEYLEARQLFNKCKVELPHDVFEKIKEIVNTPPCLEQLKDEWVYAEDPQIWPTGRMFSYYQQHQFHKRNIQAGLVASIFCDRNLSDINKDLPFGVKWILQDIKGLNSCFDIKIKATLEEQIDYNFYISFQIWEISKIEENYGFVAELFKPEEFNYKREAFISAVAFFSCLQKIKDGVPRHVLFSGNKLIITELELQNQPEEDIEIRREKIRKFEDGIVLGPQGNKMKLILKYGCLSPEDNRNILTLTGTGEDLIPLTEVRAREMVLRAYQMKDGSSSSTAVGLAFNREQNM